MEAWHWPDFSQLCLHVLWTALFAVVFSVNTVNTVVE